LAQAPEDDYKRLTSVPREAFCSSAKARRQGDATVAVLAKTRQPLAIRE
jgi:hypothetical protein